MYDDINAYQLPRKQGWILRPFVFIPRRLGVSQTEFIEFHISIAQNAFNHHTIQMP